ncbi:MAG TPA: HAD family phosphatase [Jatrophihabitans sp.]|nr:HAD family phosphatase [Jatrophihabitans sp.]
MIAASPLQAVLWDMDGTLVDTEPYWITAEYRLVESYGHSWNDQHAHAIVGKPLLVSAAYIREHGRVPLEPAEIVDQLLAAVIADVRRHIEWRPGVLPLLREITAAGLPSAMVTMSYRNLAGVVAAAAPAGSFDTLVCGDDVRNGKPDPEPYLLAAARLGVDPASCLAIEDSPSGIASAEAAGCVVVAVPNQVPVPPAPSRTTLASLAGVSLARLQAIAADRVGV